ncbi:tetratricopeptide repeat protein, partial [bacterium AH-315-M05]|nr:tetratricopeptide repeat protein [bacterium AH-315-M05]
GTAVALNNIGFVYSNQQQYEKALEYYKKSLKIENELANKLGIARMLNNIGLIYRRQNKLKLALEQYLQCKKLREEIGDKLGLAQSLNNIGFVYKSRGQPGKAIEYFLNGIKLYKEINAKRGLANTLNNVAVIYKELENWEKAIEYCEKALALSIEIGNPENLLRVTLTLSEIYALQNDYKQAYKYHIMTTKMKDSLLNAETHKQITEIQQKYENEKSQKEIELLNKDKELQTEQLNKQKIIIWAGAGGLLFVIVLAFLIYKGYRQKQKANLQLAKKNTTITRQKEEIEAKNEDITASIRYAKEIQEAILLTNKEIAELLPNSFVLFKPKDIVSGDFYWATQTKDNTVIWAAADCTGHGVPGAFMSMMGNALLNEIVIEKGITEPAQILNELKTRIIKALSQTGEIGEHKDGMDISLCVWHKDTSKLEFAGAYNPLYLVRKGELIETKADRQSVGYVELKGKPFTNHQIQLQKGDTLYTFSDGYADQYGGEDNSSYGKGKKFSKKRFKELVLSLQRQSMTKQKETFDTTIENYKGDLEQIDDILVIGVRI